MEREGGTDRLVEGAGLRVGARGLEAWLRIAAERVGERGREEGRYGEVGASEIIEKDRERGSGIEGERGSGR